MFVIFAQNSLKNGLISSAAQTFPPSLIANLPSPSALPYSSYPSPLKFGNSIKFHLCRPPRILEVWNRALAMEAIGLVLRARPWLIGAICFKLEQGWFDQPRGERRGSIKQRSGAKQQSNPWHCKQMSPPLPPTLPSLISLWQPPSPLTLLPTHHTKHMLRRDNDKVELIMIIWSIWLTKSNNLSN